MDPEERVLKALEDVQDCASFVIQAAEGKRLPDERCPCSSLRSNGYCGRRKREPQLTRVVTYRVSILGVYPQPFLELVRASALFMP